MVLGCSPRHLDLLSPLDQSLFARPIKGTGLDSTGSLSWVFRASCFPTEKTRRPGQKVPPGPPKATSEFRLHRAWVPRDFCHLQDSLTMQASLVLRHLPCTEVTEAVAHAFSSPWDSKVAGASGVVPGSPRRQRVPLSRDRWEREFLAGPLSQAWGLGRGTVTGMERGQRHGAWTESVLQAWGLGRSGGARVWSWLLESPDSGCLVKPRTPSTGQSQFEILYVPWLQGLLSLWPESTSCLPHRKTPHTPSRLQTGLHLLPRERQGGPVTVPILPVSLGGREGENICLSSEDGRAKPALGLHLSISGGGRP